MLCKMSNHTVGVFPADKIPRVWTKPTAFVFNTQKNSLPGEHWVAVYVDKNGHGIYFDSYGLPPYVHYHVKRLEKNCKKFNWNTTMLQSETSKVCGQFCIMFLDFMSRGMTMTKFLQSFSTHSLKKNDSIAALHVKKMKLKKYIKSRFRARCTYTRSDFAGNGSLRLQYCNCKKKSYGS